MPEDCPLCSMKKLTEWHLETEQCIVADTLGGSPFVVLKRHTTEPTDEEKEHMRNAVESVFGKHELLVMMNVVEDHFHAHIRGLHSTLWAQGQ